MLPNPALPFFFRWTLRNQTQVFMLTWQTLYQLNHLPSPLAFWGSLELSIPIHVPFWTRFMSVPWAYSEVSGLTCHFPVRMCSWLPYKILMLTLFRENIALQIAWYFPYLLQITLLLLSFFMALYSQTCKSTAFDYKIGGPARIICLKATGFLLLSSS